MGDKSLVFALITFLFPLSAFSGTLVDDFNDGNLDGWRMFEYFWASNDTVWDSGNWVVKDGTAIAGDENSFKGYCLLIGDKSWRNYTAEVSVKFSRRLEEGGVYTSVSIAARHQDCCEYTCVMWRFVGRGRWGGWLWKDGTDLNTQFIDLPTEANIWYRLRISTQGNHIIGFINDRKVLDLFDELLSSGAVRIGVNGVVAWFDDFVVTGPEIPDNQLGRPVEASGKLATTWANIKISAKE